MRELSRRQAVAGFLTSAALARGAQGQSLIGITPAPAPRDVHVGLLKADLE